MSFSSSPLGFALELAEAIQSIKLGLFAHQPPATLYHYTDFKGVIGIGQSHVLRATGTTDLKHRDQTEIQHGIDMVRKEVERKHLESNSFADSLLRSLTDALSPRKCWTFVACFCPELGSSFHREKYGEYCLQFNTRSGSGPMLQPLSFYAEARFQRVIYKPGTQRKAIQQSVDSITECANTNSRGSLQGPWARSIIKGHARDAAQCLMEIITSFKSLEYGDDNEWRVVCGPRYSIASSSPDDDDKNFRSSIRIRPNNNGRYIELAAREEGPTVVASPRTIIPFSAIYVPDGFQKRDDEKTAILQMLASNGGSEIPILPFHKG